MCKRLRPVRVRRCEYPITIIIISSCTALATGLAAAVSRIVVVAAAAEVLLYVHRNRRLISDGSPGRPPRFSHSSRVPRVVSSDWLIRMSLPSCPGRRRGKHGGAYCATDWPPLDPSSLLGVAPLGLCWRVDGGQWCRTD